MPEPDSSYPKFQPSRLWHLDVWLLGLVWTLLLIASCWWNLVHEERRVEEMVRVQARTAHYKDVVYRFWNSAHGWVYVPVDEKTPPNPYLSQIPERDILTPSGKQLTLMNPAYMTRQAHELEEKRLGIRGHLTSLLPLRPENSPDPWEAQALKRFEKGETEISSVEMIDGEAFMRLMRPLMVEEACMRCHASQGYQIGQVRGGISVAVAMAPTLALVKTSKTKLLAAHLLLWLMGIGVVVMRATTQKHREEDRQRAAAALQGANHNLEKRVQQRTRELQQSEARLLEAQSIAQIGNWEWDLKSDKIHCSIEVWRIFGFDSAPADESFDAFIALVHPDDRRRVLRLANRSIKEGAPYQLDHRIIRPDGCERVVHGQARTSRNDSDEILRLTGTIQDITERVHATRTTQTLTEQLQQAQKFETIGTLASGIAHDFNNILMPISGYTELAQHEGKSSEDTQRYLKQVMIAAERGKELVQQVLAFSRKAELDRRPLHLNSIIQEALQLLRSSLPSTISIEETYEDERCTVSADAGQIHQVVMNICTNAYQAMRANGGKLSIALKQQRIASNSELIGTIVQTPGDYALLCISDSGPGMDQRTLARIFEPFFTTKTQGEGTGLGLAVVHGIIHAHHGGVRVASEPGTGTSFQIYLPITGQEIAPPNLIRPVPGKRNERLLLVDDETEIVEMLSSGLSRLGFRVTGCTDSLRAMEIFQNSPAEFDLLLTDQTMPGITGLQLAKLVRETRPELPVVLMTGFASMEQREAAMAAGVNDYLLKPLGSIEVARALVELLDNRQAQSES